MKATHAFMQIPRARANGISGGFEFSNWGEGDLTEKARKRFPTVGWD